MYKYYTPELGIIQVYLQYFKVGFYGKNQKRQIRRLYPYQTKQQQAYDEGYAIS